MIFTILSVALLVFGIIGVCTYWEKDVMEFFSILSLVIGVICSIIVLVAFISAKSNNIDFPNEYAVNKAYIETVYTNKQLTGEERVKAVEMATDINGKILKSRAWRDNIWFGWLNASTPGDFELIDMAKIQSANQYITIEQVK